MAKFKPMPPIQELQQVFDYDPVTGIFITKRARGRVKIGDRVGHRVYRTDGTRNCIRFDFNKRKFCAHRVAWFLMTGNDPLNRHVDHRDRNPFNNVFSNLRLATDLQNQGNRVARGWIRTPCGRYCAQIGIKGKKVHVGVYTTPEEAREAYVAKHIEIHGKFSPYT